MTACVSRNASIPPETSASRCSCRSAPAIESACACGPFLCEWVSLSGSESSRKSNRSRCASQAATQPGVLVAHAGEAELAAAAGVARRVDVGVEQLARPHDRLAEQLPGQARERGVARDAVLVAPAVDEERRPRRADSGVVERLEHRLDLVAEVLHVHLVDRVGELLVDPEARRGAEARAVLDVAALLAVKPVHRRDPVAVLERARGDRRRAHRRDRGERRAGLAHEGAALDRSAARTGASAALDRPVDLRRLGSVDHGQDELARSHPPQRRMRRPAYFWSERPRPRSSEHDQEPQRYERQRREQDAQPGQDERDPLGVERQRRGGGRVLRALEALAHPAEDAARDRPGERRADDAGGEPRPPSVVAVVEAAGEQQRAQADAQAGERRLARPGLDVAAAQDARAPAPRPSRPGTRGPPGTRSRCRRSRRQRRPRRARRRPAQAGTGAAPPPRRRPAPCRTSSTIFILRRGL